MTDNVNIKTYRGLAGLDEIATEWNFITNAMEYKRFFHLVEWYRCYLSALEDQPDTVLFTVVYIGNDPEAIFPLKISSRRILGLKMKVLQLPSHPHMCLNDFVVARPERVNTYVPLVLNHLRETPELSWDYIYLPRVLEESAAAIALAEQSKILAVQRSCGQCDYLTVRPYNLIFQGFSSTFRNNIRRAKKRAETFGKITYTSVSKRPELDVAYELFLDVEASGWKGKKGIGTAIKLDKKLESFYRCLMESYSKVCGCEIHIMWHDEKPIAVEFSLITDGTLYTLKIGYDESYASCSPGHLLREYLMRYCGEKRGINFNNLVTDASWHSQWKPDSYNVFHYYICKQTMRGWVAYMYQKTLLQIRPVWLILKPKLKSLNITPGRLARAH